MRIGLIANMVSVSLLFLLYMFIKKNEKRYLMRVNIVSDLDENTLNSLKKELIDLTNLNFKFVFN